MKNSKLKAIDYHRNGVSGMGFHVLIVKNEGRDMLVVRFPKESDKDAGGVLCAAFDLAKLDERNIAFFENSWRGDHYADLVDPMIDASDFEDHQSTIRHRERYPMQSKEKKANKKSNRVCALLGAKMPEGVK